MSQIEQSMKELMEQVDRQLMMCDNREDQLMMACAMMQRVKELFDLHIGERGRKIMFKDMV